MITALPHFTRSAITTAPIRAAARFSSKNGAVNFKTRTGLEFDEIRHVIPSAFAPAAHRSRSERYAYIPTATVIEKLYAEGWRVFSAKQGGTREEEKRGFTKHQMRLRHVSNMALIPGQVIGEVILTNSHDGTSAYHLAAGAFRVVCANGLTTPHGIADAIRIPHKGDIADLVIDGCITLAQEFPRIGENIREMQAQRLTDGEARAFASAALALRYGAEESPLTPEKILTPRRSEDVQSDVFTVFNRVQENIIKGGLRYLDRDEAGRVKAMRRTREVKGIDSDSNLNRGLWTLAEEMRRLKTAA